MIARLALPAWFVCCAVVGLGKGAGVALAASDVGEGAAVAGRVAVVDGAAPVGDAAGRSVLVCTGTVAVALIGSTRLNSCVGWP